MVQNIMIPMSLTVVMEKMKLLTIKVDGRPPRVAADDTTTPTTTGAGTTGATPTGGVY